MKSTKNIIRSFLAISFIFFLSLSVHSQFMGCQPESPCNNYKVDATVDPDLQCFLLNQLGPGVTLDASNQFYTWQRTNDIGVVYIDRMWINRSYKIEKYDCSNEGTCTQNLPLRGIRRLYIDPQPYITPNAGKSEGTKQVHLGKFYYYNVKYDRFIDDEYMLESKGRTINDWFIVHQSDYRITRSGPRGRLANDKLAYVEEQSPAWRPDRVVPFDLDMFRWILPSTYNPVDMPLNDQRVVLQVPAANLNDTLGILIDGITAPFRVNVFSVTKRNPPSTANLLGEVIVNPGTIAIFEYNIGPNEFLKVMPHPSMYYEVVDPDGTKRWVTDETGGMYGNFRSSVQERRYPDNICLFGTEAPVVGEDVDAAGNVIKLNP